ncbi:MAG: hypothetical protein RTU30_16460 [Candidatus Thorarchaeota archaeon]
MVESKGANPENTIVYTQDGDAFSANVRWSAEGPYIESHQDRTSLDGAWYSVETETVIQNGESVERGLPTPLKIRLTPYLTRPYPYCVLADVSRDQMYPSSTGSWYARYTDGLRQNCQTYYYSLQEIEDDDKVWLTVVSPESKVFESHAIEVFEAETLTLTDDIYKHRRAWGDEAFNSEGRKKIVDSLLDRPAPTWHQLREVTRGVMQVEYERPPLTMRDALLPYIPKRLSLFREEFAAFLAWTLLNHEPPYDEDPLEYIQKFYCTRVMSSLISSHLYYLSSNLTPPHYLTVIREILESPMNEPIHVGADLALIVEGAIREQTPGRNQLTIDYLSSLGSDVIIPRTPFTSQEALTSKAAWSKRLQYFLGGLHTGGRPHVRGMGLQGMFYLGSAHRWPHRYMTWVAQIGLPGANYLQEIVVPRHCVETILRARPRRVLMEKWALLKVNTSLYDAAKKTWRFDLDTFADGLDSEYKLARLENDLKVPTCFGDYIPSSDEVEALDTLCKGFNVWKYEVGLGNYEEYLRDSEALSNLVNRGLVQVVSYPYLIVPNLVVIAKGHTERIASLIKASVSASPRTSIYLCDEGTASILFLSIPENHIKVAETINSYPTSDDFSVRCALATNFWGYRNKFFQNLLKGDGSGWDDDLSPILSQVRSVPYREGKHP